MYRIAFRNGKTDPIIVEQRPDGNHRSVLTLAAHNGVTLDEMAKMLEVISNALYHMNRGNEPIGFISPDDVKAVEGVDPDKVTDEVVALLADDLLDNDAFRESIGIALHSTVHSGDYPEILRQDAEERYGFRTGQHVCAAYNMTDRMLGIADSDNIRVPVGTDGVIVGFNAPAELPVLSVEVEWYLTETPEEEDDGEWWNVAPEWLDNDE